MEEYVDDGFTGTNFNRPAFTRLLDDVQNGKVNCVIVKDLSRLGRNYIEMGRFISKIFPSLGVRLVAVNDNFDSFDEGNASNQIIVPFKNLINDAYCRDMSLKIRSQLDIKRRNGKFIGSFPLYGYEKDEKDHNHLVIDETAAKVVELIFNMKLDGYGTKRIVEKLTEMKIPTPLEYKRMRGHNYNSGFRAKEDPAWSVTSINRILRNEMYTGTMVQGKRRKINYKVKQIVDMNEGDWMKVENTHEAIVPKGLFDTVQKIMEMDLRTPPKEENVYVLSGLTKCGDCGQNMIRRMTARRGKKYYYYHCTTYKNGGGCTSHNMSEIKLCDDVLQAIHLMLSFLADANAILKELENRPHDMLGVTLLDRQMEAQAREITRYNDLKVKLYMDMTDGVVSKEEFKELNGTFTVKLDSLNHALHENEKRKEKKLAFNINHVPWISEFLQYQNVEKLDRRMVVTLVESVVVHGGDRIEVNFQHKEEMEEILAVARMVKEGIA